MDSSTKVSLGKVIMEVVGLFLSRNPQTKSIDALIEWLKQDAEAQRKIKSAMVNAGLKLFALAPVSLLVSKLQDWIASDEEFRNMIWEALASRAQAPR